MQATATPNTDNLGPLIWVLCHNDAKRDEDLLKAEAWRLQRLKTNPTRTALIAALYSGMVSLRHEVFRTAQHARDCGLLPYCWSGTKVLEGGAA